MSVNSNNQPSLIFLILNIESGNTVIDQIESRLQHSNNAVAI